MKAFLIVFMLFFATDAFASQRGSIRVSVRIVDSCKAVSSDAHQRPAPKCRKGVTHRTSEKSDPLLRADRVVAIEF